MGMELSRVDRAETLRYLGWRGSALAEELLSDLARCESLLVETARPRTVWRLFSLAPDGSLAGTAYRPAGQDIRRHLDGCGQVILMAATLGAETEQLLRQMQKRSMSDAVILDAMANAAIEQVCDTLCAELREAFAPRFLTERYSPGYGDMPLTDQAALFRVLDVSRRIGVSLTPGGLMLPQKSVTALIGVSDTPRAVGRGCAGCANAGDCLYRKDGMHCGKA